MELRDHVIMQKCSLPKKLSKFKKHLFDMHATLPAYILWPFQGGILLSVSPHSLPWVFLSNNDLPEHLGVM